jgi:hypothetical protein
MSKMKRGWLADWLARVDAEEEQRNEVREQWIKSRREEFKKRITALVEKSKALAAGIGEQTTSIVETQKKIRANYPVPHTKETVARFPKLTLVR